MAQAKKDRLILWFEEIGIKDVPYVGGKNASLGEMYQNLTKQGINVPYGFAITAQAYDYFLEEAGIREEMEAVLRGVNTRDVQDLAMRGHQIRELILGAEMPKRLEEEIVEAYTKLSKKYRTSSTDVAVRSSATAEDLPDASFAGQQETYLNITGGVLVLEAVQKCMASLFTNRAISYREDKNFNHFDVKLSVTIQKMVRSDLAGSGVMFTIDTETGFDKAVLLNAAYGLGENVVQGTVNPDQYFIFKPTLEGGNGQRGFKYRPIISRQLGSKSQKMVYSAEGSESTRNVPVPEEDQEKFVMNDDEVLQLAWWAVLIENHYKKPMDIEWAKDGKTKELFIVQARPETVHGSGSKNFLVEYKLEKTGTVILEGESIGSKIGQGKANVIEDVKDISKFKEGEVLITEITDPDWEPIMKIASAIVTNSGGRTSHAAIVSRELGIPCIVGTGEATEKIKTDQSVTVSCAEGEKGRVYKGIIPFRIEKTDLAKFGRPKTQIMMNVADPMQAFDFSMIPNDGVGLAREEMIILNFIKVHPKALINYTKITDEKIKSEIDQITKGYQNKKKFFVDKLSEGVARIAAAFYPNDVILRMVDLKSNEYAGLIGGKEYEPSEENPMIGWRGASRYYSEPYEDAFALECEALKKVRDGMGLYNVKLMIPFCRTPEEGRRVVELMAKYGLKRKGGGWRAPKRGTKRNFEDLEIYVMAELPSNVVLADDFAEIFDGFSIGSNDLTQLTLGLDRDSGLVSHIFDERNEAVKMLVAQVIKAAHKNSRKVGICGQGPSDFPEFAEFLVEQGIDSISLTPDTVMKTTINIINLENKMARKKATKKRVTARKEKPKTKKKATKPRKKAKKATKAKAKKVTRKRTRKTTKKKK